MGEVHFDLTERAGKPTLSAEDILAMALKGKGFDVHAVLGVRGARGLVLGAAGLISTFGTEQQKRKYMDPMYAGNWGGTMVLTEPDAGSDLQAVRLRAHQDEDEAGGEPTPGG